MNDLPKITSVFLNVTNACNLACPYCFVEQHPNHMSLEIAKDAVQFLLKNTHGTNTTPSITFFGGEPMLCWESVVRPLTIYIRDELSVSFSLSITTNGVLLTPEIINFFHKNDVGVMLSIDGAKETQDVNRPLHDGSGSFDSLKGIIPRLLKTNPGMTFRSTLIPETCSHIWDNIQFAQSCGYTNFFLIPNVFQAWSTEARAVAEASFKHYTDYFIQSYRDGVQPIRCTPLEDGFKRILEVNSAVASNQCRGCKTAYQKCGLGAAGFGSIDYQGNLYACQEMTSCKGEGDPFYIGTIYGGASDALRFKLIQQFDSDHIVGEDCKNCSLYRICDGGCVANNYLSGGSVNAVSLTYCWWMKLMLSEAARIIKILGEEHNEQFRGFWYSLHGTGGCICQR